MSLSVAGVVQHFRTDVRVVKFGTKDAEGYWQGAQPGVGLSPYGLSQHDVVQPAENQCSIQ